MKIQKGMVKYKDRNDIICMYGVTDAGKLYYFLDNSDTKLFSNGNRVVSTELVEAIDSMVKASKIGVIDPNGNEVIACENKSVKQISDGIVLVEKAVPTTESVLSAINNRNDSQYAAQLVSTPAQIKDNIYKQMGTEGRFLFNDQFSEATICDINGNNLVNGEVYSFIAINNDTLYMSKNLPDSNVEHLVLNVATNALNGNVENVENNDVIDVNDVKVPIEDVENALEEQSLATGNNVIQDNFETDISTPLYNVNEGLDLPSTDDFLAATNLGAGIPTAPENNVVENSENTTETNSEVESYVETEDSNTVEDVAPIDDISVDIVSNVTEVQGIAPSEDVSSQEELNSVEAPVENKNLVQESALETVEQQDSIESLQEENTVEENPVEVAEEVPMVEEPKEMVEEVQEEISAVEEPEEIIEEVQEEIPVVEEPEEMVEEVQEEIPVVEEPEEIVEEVQEEIPAVEEPEEIVEEVQEEIPVVEEPEEMVEEVQEEIPVVEEPEELFNEVNKDNLDLDTKNDFNIFDSKENISETNDFVDDNMVDNYLKNEKELIMSEDEIQSLFDRTSLDLFNGGPLQIDSIMQEAEEFDAFPMSVREASTSENLFGDLAKSMEGLIRQNKEQRATLANYETVIKSLHSTKNELKTKISEAERYATELLDRNRALESAVIKLKTRIEMLTNMVKEKDEKISRQTVELERLKPQLEGREQLIGLLKDAQFLIGSDKSVDDIDEYGYRKVA